MNTEIRSGYETGFYSYGSIHFMSEFQLQSAVDEMVTSNRSGYDFLERGGNLKIVELETQLRINRGQL